MKAVRRVFETFKPDIVHIQDHYSLGRNAAITAQRLGVKRVGTNHFMPENLAPYVPVLSQSQPVFNWVLWKWMSETYNRLKCHSRTVRTAAGCRSAGLRPPVFPISCGVNTDLFRPTRPWTFAWRTRYGINPDKIVLFLRRSGGQGKRLDVLLRALRLMDRADIQ